MILQGIGHVYMFMTTHENKNDNSHHLFIHGGTAWTGKITELYPLFHSNIPTEMQNFLWEGIPAKTTAKKLRQRAR